MKDIIELDSDHGKEFVLDHSEQNPVILNFWAPWSQTHDRFRPMLETVARDYGLVLIHVNVDHKKNVAENFGVKGVPDVRLVTDGNVVDGFAGALPEPEVRDFVEQHLSEVVDAKSTEQA